MAVLRKRVSLISKSIEKLRAICQHPNATKKHGSNTGNYDPSADIYWIDVHCPDCGKIWQTEQE
jgi:hypothetical protein